ncbi:MAG: carboxylesterase family protein, partial [Bacteroidaceae bacterium]|nr:carboxylesterase family protein [Bacteroidaceae bacterium]
MNFRNLFATLLFLLPLTLGAQVFDSSTEATKVPTKYGEVAGYIDNDVYTYKGIPYAKADRFQPAQEPESWQGIRSCRHWGPVCPQAKNTGWRADANAFFYQWNDGYQSEDCLRLNIWTKGRNDGKKRPVLFWLHGGGYTSGNGQEHPGYDGRNLADKGDVVVVTINHRLNVLGYLDLSA